jgi:AcrR family transcriptional regulator
MHILKHARALLTKYGYGGFTYAALASTAHVSRQTVYHYWPTREQLLRDMLLEGPFTEYFGRYDSSVPSADARTAVHRFLIELRDGMELPDIAGPLTLLISDAERDPGARETLRAVFAGRLDYVNDLLLDTGVSIDANELSILTGALLARRFIHHVPVDDDYIDYLVATWWAARGARQLN